MAATSVNYGSLLRSTVKQNGYLMEYSGPELVTGGLCPPPSRHFPGTLCYMVTVTANGNSYYGFGPTPKAAKHFAEFEAYNALHPLPVEEVERARNFIPETGESESEGEPLASMNVSNLSQGSDASDTTVVDDSPTNNKRQPSFAYPYSPTLDSSCVTGEVCRDITKVETQTFSTSTSERVAIQPVMGQETRSPVKTTRTDTETFCEIPQSFRPRKYSVPKDVDETIAVLEETTTDESIQSPGTYMFSGTKRRDVVDTLLEEAKKKGVGVSFQVYTVGPPHARLVLARAIGGGMQCEGYHRKRKVAKALAACNLLKQLQGKPSRKGGRHVPYPGDIERPASCMPSLHSVHQASSRPELHSPSDNVSSNPVGQLEELFMKELHNLPVYAEHVSGVGKYVEYECVVSGKGLSAKGVGSSKKLAKRHASENLLAVMSAEGMNTNPSLVSLKMKKPQSHSGRYKGPNHPRSRSRCATPMPVPPSRFHNLPPLPYCNPPPPPYHNRPPPPHSNPPPPPYYYRPPPPHCNLLPPPHSNPPPPPYCYPPPPPYYDHPPPPHSNHLNSDPPFTFAGPPHQLGPPRHLLPHPCPTPLRHHPYGPSPSPYPFSPLAQRPSDPCQLPPSLHSSPKPHRFPLHPQQAPIPHSQHSPWNSEELSSSTIYESGSDSDLESSSQVISQGLSEIVPPEARSTSSSHLERDSGCSHSSSLVDSISQLAVSLNDYVDRNLHTPTCSGGRGVVSANRHSVSSHPSHCGSSQQSLVQPSRSETSRESVEWSPKAKPQPPANMDSNSSATWVPQQLSPKPLLPDHTMHYSDPLNFTMRLPKGRTELWSNPPNLRKEVVKPKPLHPPWVSKSQHVNAAVPPKTLQVNLGACDVDNASVTSESTWASVSDVTPELPPHPLMYRLGLESSQSQRGSTAVTEGQSEKPSSSVRDSVNISPSDVRLRKSKKLIRVVGDVVVEGGLNENASDLEDSLRCGLAGPGLPTQGSLEAMHYVLK